MARQTVVAAPTLILVLAGSVAHAQACDPYQPTQLCHGQSLLGQIMAQAICTSVKPFPILGSRDTSPATFPDVELRRGWVWAVPRDATTNCHRLCESLEDPYHGKNLECFNSIHVYPNGPATGVDQLGLRTHVYYHCDSPMPPRDPEERRTWGGWTGPNYCCCQSVGADTEQKGRHTKAGALAFAEAVIRTYLTGDGDKYRSYLADTLYTLEGEGPLSAKAVDLGEPFPFGNDYSSYTMAQVKEAHPFQIYDYDEYSRMIPALAALVVDGWSPDEDDYLFVGTKMGGNAFLPPEEVLWDDLMVFMVTYQNGIWEVICISG